MPNSQLPVEDLFLCSNIPYDKCPKYKVHELTSTQIDEIALRAAKMAVELVKIEAYTATGSFVITKVGYLVGVIVIGLALYLTKTGILEWR